MMNTTGQHNITCNMCLFAKVRNTRFIANYHNSINKVFASLGQVVIIRQDEAKLANKK